LKEEKIWSEFLWYMASPSGKDFSNSKTCDIIHSD
jgi:hypothetical protein